MLLAISLAALWGSAFTSAAISRNPTLSNNYTIIPGAYVVEFVGGHDHTSFYSSLRADGVDVSPRMNMSYQLFNGSSFSITNLRDHTGIASKISVMPSVNRIWPMRRYPPPKAQHMSAGPFLNSSGPGFVSKQDNASAAGNSSYSPHVMTQVDRLHAAGYTGEGARIAIVDTGVDYYHPALGGCFGKGCLISGGYDLAGHGYDGTGAPKPGPDPYDSCDGHGTHVTGIIGARPNEMGFTGAAPGADISMYKVFSCEGGGFGSTDDILISAFNMAFEDGADIITASIGGPGGWSEAPWSSVVGRIVENGVPCTLAAGNSGYEGMWTPSTAADGKDVTAVSSFDNVNTPYLLNKGSYSTNSTSSGSCPASASKSFGWLSSYQPFENITLPLWATSHNASVEDDACSRLPANTPDLSDYIVLIRMTTACDTYDQMSNVSAFNAQYVLFYGSTTDDLVIFEDSWIPTSISGAGVVLPEQGVEWVDLLSRGLDVRVTMTDLSSAGVVYTDVQNALTGGFASYYTSWGPTCALDVYPSLGAPGGKILSTFLLSEGGYKVASGTSMATPFMAAVYALVGQARGTFDPADLARYLSSTSRAQLWNDGSGTICGLAPVNQQGAGLVQAYDAAFVTTQVSTKGISFNDTDHFRSATFIIRNMGSRDVTYELGNSPAYSMNSLSVESDYPHAFPNPIIAATADLEFSKTSVTLPPRARANITVEPTFPGDSAILHGLLPVYSGYITINGSNGENLAIPYLGVRGSMYSAAVMTSEETGWDFENFDRSRPGIQSSYRDNATFTVPYPALGDVPILPTYEPLPTYPSAEFLLNFGTRILRADVVPMSSNYTGSTTTVLGLKIAGSVVGYPVEYQPRFYFYVAFTGMLDDGSVVPEGQYALAIRALKLFGDPEEPDDYEDLGVRDYEIAKRFYSATLPLIGLHLVYDSTETADQSPSSGDDGGGGPRTLGFGPDAENELLNIFEYGRHASAPGPGSHIAFNTDSRAVVDQFYEAAVRNGGKSNGAPGVRPHYGRAYYAAFVIDPDGWRLEVVCKEVIREGGQVQTDGNATGV